MSYRPVLVLWSGACLKAPAFYGEVLAHPVDAVAKDEVSSPVQQHVMQVLIWLILELFDPIGARFQTQWQIPLPQFGSWLNSRLFFYSA